METRYYHIKSQSYSIELYEPLNRNPNDRFGKKYMQK